MEKIVFLNVETVDEVEESPADDEKVNDTLFYIIDCFSVSCYHSFAFSCSIHNNEVIIINNFSKESSVFRHWLLSPGTFDPYMLLASICMHTIVPANLLALTSISSLLKNSDFSSSEEFDSS